MLGLVDIKCHIYVVAWGFRQKRICLPMQKTHVRFLGREDPLEEEMENHSSILAWEMLRVEEPDGLESMESQELDTS